MGRDEIGGNKMIKTKEDLMALDQKFCEQTQKGGSKSWASYFSERGIMVGGDNIVGPEAIEKTMSGFLDSENNSLVWEPIGGDISDDLTLGYTHGTYIRKTINEEGKEVVATGQYNTIWKKQADGQWKITLDIGN